MSPRTPPPPVPLPPEPVPTRGPVHERLGAFIGHWKTEGRAGAGASLPEARIFGDETYEWLPEGFFLMHRFDRRIGDGTHKGLTVMGYDAANQRYFANVFDSLGYARRYAVQVQGSVWTVAGERERARMEFNDRGDVLSADWDVSGDGIDWRHLCHLRSVRQEDRIVTAAVQRISGDTTR